MPYDIMLLADPGPERSRVLETLGSAPDFTHDERLESRFWMKSSLGDVQINIGTKDPVESIHFTFEVNSEALAEAVTLRALELAVTLDMRLEDMQWGYEVGPSDLPALRVYWKDFFSRPPIEPPVKKPWWKVW